MLTMLPFNPKYQNFADAVKATGRDFTDVEQLISTINMRLRYSDDYTWINDIRNTTITHLRRLELKADPTDDERIKELSLTLHNLEIVPQTVWIAAKTNKYDDFKNIVLAYIADLVVREGTEQWLN